MNIHFYISLITTESKPQISYVLKVNMRKADHQKPLMYQIDVYHVNFLQICVDYVLYSRIPIASYWDCINTFSGDIWLYDASRKVDLTVDTFIWWIVLHPCCVLSKPTTIKISNIHSPLRFWRQFSSVVLKQRYFWAVTFWRVFSCMVITHYYETKLLSDCYVMFMSTETWSISPCLIGV